jgi:DNA-binding NarL/FixJ family response regulator
MAIRIVIADDHGILRAGMRALLSAEPDFQVVGEAEDGSAAVQLAARLHPDVALLDISMPILNGIQAIKPLKEQSPETRVLILTLHEDESLLRQAIANGASGYIVKRAVGSELTNAIRSVCAGNLYIHPTMTRALLRDADAPNRRKESAAESLSPRELQVLKFMAQGYTNRQIAEMLHISVRTVEGHRANLAGKLGLSSPLQIVRYAMEHGLLD